MLKTSKALFFAENILIGPCHDYTHCLSLCSPPKLAAKGISFNLTTSSIDLYDLMIEDHDGGYYLIGQFLFPGSVHLDERDAPLLKLDGRFLKF